MKLSRHALELAVAKQSCAGGNLRELIVATGRKNGIQRRIYLIQGKKGEKRSSCVELRKVVGDRG
jgi:hypothetical protein